MTRRRLKKNITTMAADLLTEVLAIQQHNPNIAASDIENIVASILLMEEDYISRLSHVDKHQVRTFFRQMHDSLAVSTNELVDQIFHLA